MVVEDRCTVAYFDVGFLLVSVLDRWFGFSAGEREAVCMCECV